MTKCKIHDSEDWVECDDCGKKGCRMCEEGWVTDYEIGERRCPECEAIKKHNEVIVI